MTSSYVQKYSHFPRKHDLWLNFVRCDYPLPFTTPNLIDTSVYSVFSFLLTKLHIILKLLCWFLFYRILSLESACLLLHVQLQIYYCSYFHLQSNLYATTLHIAERAYWLDPKVVAPKVASWLAKRGYSQVHSEWIDLQGWSEATLARDEHVRCMI